IATHGGSRLSHVSVCDMQGCVTRLRADCLAVSGGFNPTLALSTHLGGRPKWDPVKSAFVPGAAPRGMTIAGAARGSFRIAEALREGTAAGTEAAEALGYHVAHSTPPSSDDELSELIPFWYVSGSKGKAFVDFQNDVTVADVALASREGYRSVELLKRY